MVLWGQMGCVVLTHFLIVQRFSYRKLVIIPLRLAISVFLASCLALMFNDNILL